MNRGRHWGRAQQRHSAASCLPSQINILLSSMTNWWCWGCRKKTLRKGSAIYIYFESESLRQWYTPVCEPFSHFTVCSAGYRWAAVCSMINELFYAVEEGRGIKEERWRNESEKMWCGSSCVCRCVCVRVCVGVGGLLGHLSCSFYCHPVVSTFTVGTLGFSPSVASPLKQELNKVP